MRHLRTLLVLALLAVAVQSCGGPDRVADGTSVLHRGLSSDPESLDPPKARSVQAQDVLRDIGEGLVSYSPGGEIVPGAAERWEISDDGLAYTFHIRPESRWSNGDPVLATDFEYSLKRLVDPATASPNAGQLSLVVNAQEIVAGELASSELGVEAVDDRTLVIRLLRPTPYLLNLLAHPSTFPVHPGSIEEHGDAFTRPGRLMSNGAYVLARRDTGALVELRRNEQYWNNENTAIDVVRHHVVTLETAELNRYRARELHTTSNVPPDNFEQVRMDFGDQLRVAPSFGLYYFGFNLTKPPFRDNLDLRKALSMAIDRETIVTRITGRGEKPAYSFVPPVLENYEPPQLSFAQLSKDEREKLARRWYREAGYGPDNPARFTVLYNTSDTHQRIALAVQAMWRDVLGVEAELVNVEFQVLMAQAQQKDVTQVFKGSWFGDYDDAYAFLYIMKTGDPMNQPGYDSDEFNQWIADAEQQNDFALRRRYLEEAERKLISDHAVIPVYFYVSKHLIRPEVRGWQDNILDWHYSQHLSLDAEQP